MNTELVTSSARNAYRYLFTQMSKNNFFESEMSKFYAEGSKNPSVAKTIMYSKVINPQLAQTVQKIEQQSNTMFKHREMNFPLTASNIRFWISHRFIGGTGVKNEQDFIEAYKKLYPKTHGVRDCLIKLGHITMDKINPTLNKTYSNYAETLKKLLKTQAMGN